MSRIYEDFIQNYGISNIQAARGKTYMSRIDNYNYNSAQYYNDREEMFDMDISRSGFDRLVDLDKRFNDIVYKEREEDYLCKKHPALKDAYDKYLMLLALYR